MTMIGKSLIVGVVSATILISRFCRPAVARRGAAAGTHSAMTPRALALSLVAAITTAVSAQQGPTFRAQVEMIQVDAFVTDGAGNPVTNLRLEDFELLEDGKEQTISTFSEVNIPIDAPPPFSPTAPRADVATNGGRDGRLYVIAVD